MVAVVPVLAVVLARKVHQVLLVTLCIAQEVRAVVGRRMRLTVLAVEPNMQVEAHPEELVTEFLVVLELLQGSPATPSSTLYMVGAEEPVEGSTTRLGLGALLTG